MSIEAIAWASRLELRPSSTKFVLVALCNYCNDDGLAWPSVETLSVFTSQDRKTVFASLRRLKELGYIEDTGRRVGATWGINVYRIAVPKTVLLCRKAVPKTDRSRPKNGTQAVPKTVHRTVKEPLLTNNGSLDKREGKTIAIADHLQKLKSAIQNNRS